MIETIRRVFGRQDSAGPAFATPVADLVQAGTIALISASCCDSGSRLHDEKLALNLDAAMQKTACKHRVLTSTITEVRAQLRHDANAAPSALAFKESLAALFQGRGLAAFPLVLIDGRIAFYGGAPEVDVLEAALKAATPAAPAARCCEYDD